MNERSKMISKLIKGRDTRESYIRSKLSVLLPAQIRSLRLRREMKQADLGMEAEMKQARISALERVGEVSFSIETLIRLASAFRVGLSVKFVPMSEMLNWENDFVPDEFDVVPIEKDETFLRPNHSETQRSISSGLAAAMLGKQDNVFNRTSTYPTINEFEPSLFSGSSLDSRIRETEDRYTSEMKMPIGSATQGATLNQSTQEQGRAA